jgi:RNA polymerase sigma factor (sigma-70 family)
MTVAIAIAIAVGAGGRAANAPQLTVVVGEVYPDWTAVYRDNVDRIYRVMYAKVGNRPDAEDLTAEVFVAALRPLRVSSSVGEVRAYLLAAARTVLAGYWRRTLGREVTSLDDESVESVFDDPPAPSRAVGRTAAILDALPDNYRRILQLRFLDSCSVREAAAAMGISTANAKVLQHRALRRAAEIAQEVSR